MINYFLNFNETVRSNVVSPSTLAKRISCHIKNIETVLIPYAKLGINIKVDKK